MHDTWTGKNSWYCREDQTCQLEVFFDPISDEWGYRLLPLAGPPDILIRWCFTSKNKAMSAADAMAIWHHGESGQ